jgi:hypothetical protein
MSYKRKCWGCDTDQPNQLAHDCLNGSSSDDETQPPENNKKRKFESMSEPEFTETKLVIVAKGNKTYAIDMEKIGDSLAKFDEEQKNTIKDILRELLLSIE